MQEPCIASAMPAARTLPFPISRTGYFSAQWKLSAQCIMHLSSAHALAVSPKYAGINMPSRTIFFKRSSTGSICSFSASSLTVDSSANIPVWLHSLCMLLPPARLYTQHRTKILLPRSLLYKEEVIYDRKVLLL